MEVKKVSRMKTTPMMYFPAFPRLILLSCPDLPVTVV